MIDFLWDSQQVPLARALTQVRASLGGHGTQDDVLRASHSWQAYELLALKRLQEQGLWEAKPKMWLERSEIDLLFATVITNLHPDGSQVREALAVGVKPAKFVALYAGDSEPIAAEIRERLRHMNMGQYSDLRKAITPLGNYGQGKLRITLTTERQWLPEPVVDVNVRLSRLSGAVIKGTYASEVHWLPETISNVLSWVESTRVWQPHEQISHVWLMMRLLKEPLFASR